MLRSKKFLLVIIVCLIAAIFASIYLSRNKTVDFQILNQAPVKVNDTGIYIREIKTSSYPEFLLLYNPTSGKILYQTYEVETKIDADILNIYIVEKSAATESQISPQLNVLFRPNIKPSAVEVYLNGQKQPYISL